MGYVRAVWSMDLIEKRLFWKIFYNTQYKCYSGWSKVYFQNRPLLLYKEKIILLVFFRGKNLLKTFFMYVAGCCLIFKIKITNFPGIIKKAYFNSNFWKSCLTWWGLNSNQGSSEAVLRIRFLDILVILEQNKVYKPFSGFTGFSCIYYKWLVICNYVYIAFKNWMG